MDWLDQDLPSKEGREATREDDGGTSYSVSRRSSNIAQQRDIGSSRKGKAPRIISSSGGNENNEDTNRDNGAGGGIVSSGVVNGGYVNQFDHDKSWAQGDENYYATQDTDHGYRLGIREQQKHLERLTTFPSDDDYSNWHDYKSIYHKIYEHFQELAL